MHCEQVYPFLIAYSLASGQPWLTDVQVSASEARMRNGAKMNKMNMAQNVRAHGPAKILAKRKRAAQMLA
eukprot:7377624-Prymnesium_polylepis.1